MPSSELDEIDAHDVMLDAGSVLAQVATVAVVGVGCAATFEAALLPGFALGVAAMLVPKVLPKAGRGAQNKLGAVRKGVRTIELAISALSLARPARAAMLRTRPR
jgi:hypothetical protein